LASRCSGCMAFLGVTMTSFAQTQAQKTVRQKDDKPQQEAKPGKAQVPESWQLTQQQKDFIDLFSTDEHIKQ